MTSALSYSRPEHWPSPEVRTLAAAFLMDAERGNGDLTYWQASTLCLIASTASGPNAREVTEREKLAVNRIMETADFMAYIPNPWRPLLAGEYLLQAGVACRQPEAFKTAEQEARLALGTAPLLKSKRGKKKKAPMMHNGHEIIAPPKPRFEDREARFPCPICKSGAEFYCWTLPRDGVAFTCRNSFCIRKIGK